MAMAAKQDIAAAVEAHTVSYISILLSPTFSNPTSRATKMAEYSLPTIAFFTDGDIVHLSDPAIFISAMAGNLAKLETDEGMCMEEVEHRVEVVGRGSALAWITWRRKGIVWTNVHFYRRMESGEVGWEGGNFDGETQMMRQLAEES